MGDEKQLGLLHEKSRRWKSSVDRASPLPGTEEDLGYILSRS